MKLYYKIFIFTFITFGAIYANAQNLLPWYCKDPYLTNYSKIYSTWGVDFKSKYCPSLLKSTEAAFDPIAAVHAFVQATSFNQWSPMNVSLYVSVDESKGHSLRNVEICLGYTLKGARAGEQERCSATEGFWVNAADISRYGWREFYDYTYNYDNNNVYVHSVNETFPAGELYEGVFTLHARTTDKKFEHSKEFKILNCYYENAPCRYF